MHKRIPVAEIELDDVTGYIVKIGTVVSPEHLPVGISIKKGVNMICDMTEKRIRILEQFAVSHMDVHTDSTEDDVTEDVAEDYSPKMSM